MLDLIIDHLGVLMFLCLVALLFTGFPVPLVLGGTSILFGLLGWAFGVFSFVEFFNIAARVWGQACENPIFTAIPMFIFMGTTMERSRVAEDLLTALQVLLKRLPGGLAISIAVMGTILAAATGIVAASVVLMTVLAYQPMIDAGYNKSLAGGAICASGTLGILIPPSIMLVFMADMLSISVGHLFVGAMIPGLVLAGLYVVFIIVIALIKPQWAPAMKEGDMPHGVAEWFRMLTRSFLPPVFLMFLVLGSIILGWATPTEAAGVGAAGAVLLMIFSGRLDWTMWKEVTRQSALTIGMVFGIVIGATCFAYMFRSLGGDDVIIDFVEGMDIGSWGILFLLMGLVFILGFFFEWLEITLIMLPIMYPILKILDFGDHVSGDELFVWFAIIMAVNLQTSFLTPPFGFSLFCMKGVAPPGVRMEHLYKGIVPFVILQLIGLGIVIAFPAVALWLPRVVFD